MHHKLKQSLISIFVFLLAFFTSSTLFLSLYTTPSHAAVDVTTVAKILGTFADDGPWAATKEFCDKRSGELMNLETWFSGKCGKDVKSSIRGEGVGFVDIISLQGMESVFSLFGPTYKTLPEQFVDGMAALEQLQTSIHSKPLNPLAIDTERLKLQNSSSPVAQIEKSILFFLTKKPASTTTYVEYIATNLKRNHIVSYTYAASPGYGFQSLSPILPLWRAFRNISYVLFALAFVIYGIMIMFRIRVDSKTAATIQLAIPNLISTLLLITFSYAIVGLLIDISTVLMALSIDILRAGGIITGYQNWFIKATSGQSYLGLFGSFFVNGIVSLITTPIVVMNVLFGGVLGTLSSIAIFAGIAASITSLGGMIIVAFLLALLISYGKIFFSVIKSYIAVIIALIFSPIILLGNILPGSKSFSSWIMNIIANLAVFPVITFFLVLSYALMMQPLASLFGGAGFFGVADLTNDAWVGGFWTPPMTSVTGDITGLDVNGGAMMLALIGVGLLFMCSKYADMVLEALKVPPFKYGTAIGEALKQGWSKAGLVYNNPGTATSTIYQKASNVSGLPAGPGIIPKP